VTVSKQGTGGSGSNSSKGRYYTHDDEKGQNEKQKQKRKGGGRQKSRRSRDLLPQESNMLTLSSNYVYSTGIYTVIIVVQRFPSQREKPLPFPFMISFLPG
jgi:hypothetical protein